MPDRYKIMFRSGFEKREKKNNNKINIKLKSLQLSGS